MASSPKTTTVKDQSIAQELMKAMLVGSGYSGFCFDAIFYLRFVKPRGAQFRGHEVPQVVELQLLGPWRVGDARSWQRLLRRLADSNAAQPEEPVQAYELASLRWQNGTVVEKVVLGTNDTVIRFSGGQEIVIEMQEDEEAWLLSAPEKTINARFSVASEDKNYYACFPSDGILE